MDDGLRTPIVSKLNDKHIDNRKKSIVDNTETDEEFELLDLPSSNHRAVGEALNICIERLESLEIGQKKMNAAVDQINTKLSLILGPQIFARQEMKLHTAEQIIIGKDVCFMVERKKQLCGKIAALDREITEQFKCVSFGMNFFSTFDNDTFSCCLNNCINNGFENCLSNNGYVRIQGDVVTYHASQNVNKQIHIHAPPVTRIAYGQSRYYFSAEFIAQPSPNFNFAVGFWRVGHSMIFLDKEGWLYRSPANRRRLFHVPLLNSHRIGAGIVFPPNNGAARIFFTYNENLIECEPIELENVDSLRPLLMLKCASARVSLGNFVVPF